jgi:hypothetical protein
VKRVVCSFTTALEQTNLKIEVKVGLDGGAGRKGSVGAEMEPEN